MTWAWGCENCNFFTADDQAALDHSDEFKHSLAMTPLTPRLYQVAREITDEVMGAGAYGELNLHHPDPRVRAQAAISLANQQKGRTAVSTAEPSVNDLSPVAPEGQEIEPVAVIDTTGSMSWPNSPDDPAERRQILGEAMGAIVTTLGAEDSQAAAEKAAGEDKGGLLTFTFADGEAEELGDLNADNWRQKWNSIRWGGGTMVMPGYNMALEAYMEEFGSRSPMDRPQLAMLLITDGEAQDTDEFAQALSQVKGKGYVILAIMGHGDEHDRALEVYRKVAEGNDHVRVVTFGSTTDPTVISDGVLALLGEK